MKHYILVLTTVVTFSCHPPNNIKQVTEAMKDCLSEFDIQNYNLIVHSYDENKEMSEFKDGNISIMCDQLNSFKNPIVLKQELNNGSIKTIDSFLYKGVDYSVMELLLIPNNKSKLSSVDFAQLDSIYANVLTTKIHNKHVNLSPKSFLKSLVHVSQDLHKSYITNIISDTIFPNPEGNKQLNDTYSFAGWRVFVFDKNPILWNYTVVEGKSILLINILSHGMYIGVTFPEEKMKPPIEDNKIDFLSNPICASLLRCIFCSDTFRIAEYKDCNKKTDSFVIR